MRPWEALALLGALALSLLALEKAFSLKPLPQAPCREGPLPQGADLWSNGGVEIPLCQKARVRLHLEGTVAGGQGPWAILAEGERVLFQGEVRGRETVEVETSGQAPLVLAFVNDFYKPPEDRNLFLRGLEVLPLR